MTYSVSFSYPPDINDLDYEDCGFIFDERTGLQTMVPMTAPDYDGRDMEEGQEQLFKATLPLLKAQFGTVQDMLAAIISHPAYLDGSEFSEDDPDTRPTA